MKPAQLSVLGLIALLLLVLEVGLEVRAHRRGYESILFGRGTVRFESGSNPGEGLLLEAGPLPGFPFRSPVIPRSKSDGVVRIWFASSSHGEDTAVPVPDVFPNRLGIILEEMGQSVEILNASRAGLVIANNVRDLDRNGPTWEPDLVVLYGLSMDLGVLSKQFLLEGTESAESWSEQVPVGLVSGPFRELDKLHERTVVYAQLKSNVTTLVTMRRLLADSLPSAAEDRLRASVNEFVEVALRIGATPILTTFATSHGWNGPDSISLGAAKFMVRYNPYLKPAGWLKSVQTLNQVFREVAAEREVVLIDLEEDLTNKHWLFRDPVHFTVEGHREMAALLAAGISEAIGWKRAGGMQ